MEESIEYDHRPSLEGWRETAGFAECELRDIIYDIDECRKDVDEILEAARTQGDWPSKGEPYFDNYFRGEETDEEVEEMARKVQEKWSSVQDLIVQARELLSQAASVMSDFGDTPTDQAK